MEATGELSQNFSGLFLLFSPYLELENFLIASILWTQNLCWTTVVLRISFVPAEKRLFQLSCFFLVKVWNYWSHNGWKNVGMNISAFILLEASFLTVSPWHLQPVFLLVGNLAGNISVKYLWSKPWSPRISGKNPKMDVELIQWLLAQMQDRSQGVCSLDF